MKKFQKIINKTEIKKILIISLTLTILILLMFNFNYISASLSDFRYELIQYCSNYFNYYTIIRTFILISIFLMIGLYYVII